MLIILLIISVIIVLLIIISKKDDNLNMTDNNIVRIENKELSSTESPISYKKYYKPKIYITTLNEMKFYKVLLEIAKELDYTLFSQVSLYNIISIQDNLDYSTHTKYFNKIASKSIDFVLVDDKCRIKLCIELDDSTHNKKARIERDEFINKLFKDLEINLLRYPVYQIYYKETLKRKIQEVMKDHYYAN